MNPGPLRQMVVLAGRDLRIEARTREVALVTVPFGALALLVVPMGVGTATPLLRQIGPGVYWAVILLFGTMVTMRRSAQAPPAVRALLRLSGPPPVVRLAGRALADAVLLLAFAVALLPVAVALYDPAPAGRLWLLLALPLVALGLGVLGALAGALADGAAGRTLLGPLLLVPLALPLLLGATQISEAARYGRPPGPWLLLVLTTVLTAVLLASVTAPHLEEVA